MSDQDPVEPDLTEEETEAGFDLGTDVAEPQTQYGTENFDIANDLGYGNGPAS
ncbi:hypothetical protein [Kribbella jiaozuonensis]|uniref:hypothetical protein n=1 Tax=Kribbella jiaozuonensis TaxID=2575441 RepID=UPI001484FCCE|nr:hypothetical protein [Kribbella jiaozuonensis]